MSSIAGTRKARVLPEPVLAAPTRSLPSSRAGIERAWMGVMSVKPMSAMPFSVASQTLLSSAEKRESLITSKAIPEPGTAAHKESLSTVLYNVDLNANTVKVWCINFICIENWNCLIIDSLPSTLVGGFCMKGTCKYVLLYAIVNWGYCTLNFENKQNKDLKFCIAQSNACIIVCFFLTSGVAAYILDTVFIYFYWRLSTASDQNKKSRKFVIHEVP